MLMSLSKNRGSPCGLFTTIVRVCVPVVQGSKSQESALTSCCLLSRMHGTGMVPSTLLLVGVLVALAAASPGLYGMSGTLQVGCSLAGVEGKEVSGE